MKTEFKRVELRPKIDLLSHPVRTKRLTYIQYYYIYKYIYNVLNKGGKTSTIFFCNYLFFNCSQLIPTIHCQKKNFFFVKKFFKELLCHKRSYEKWIRKVVCVKLNKSWKWHFTKQQLSGHLPTISKAIKTRWTRHARHCWRSKEELISYVPVDPFTRTNRCWKTN